MGLLFLTFVLLPIMELFLLIRIGQRVGAAPVWLLVIVMGIAGAVLAKRQGRKVLQAWQEALAAGRVPEEGVLGGVLVLVGGLLLIMPGILSDIAGLLCLVPATRRRIARALQRYLGPRVGGGQVAFHGVGFDIPPVQHPPRGRVNLHTRPRARPSERPRRNEIIDTEGEEV